MKLLFALLLYVNIPDRFAFTHLWRDLDIEQLSEELEALN
jgi:hypothetical protein